MISTRHPRCDCNNDTVHEDLQQDRATLALARDLMARAWNFEQEDICGRQKLVALMMAAQAMYKRLSIPDDVADREISEAIEVARTVRHSVEDIPTLN